MNLHKLVKDELSGSVAKSFVAQVSRFHRIQGSPMFHEATEYVKNELLRFGFQDATIERFPANGKTKYWTYTSPIGWEVKSAELQLVEPEEKLLCTFEDCPQSLHTFSNATPVKGVTAELVDVGKGTKQKDYEGKNVKGKFVLATGRARLVHRQAVYKHGAAGVITDTITYEMPNVRESVDIPDAHAYQAIWPTGTELSKVAFGFSISKRQGNALRTLLQAGKTVKLKANVEARLFPFHADVLTATIRGSEEPNKEIFLVAHLCHPKPSANDNASGSGLLLEVARTIKTLLKTGKIPPPARTIRFIWVPETLGTVAYLSHHQEMSSRLLAGINLDMVGQNQELCKSTLYLDRTPDSLPSYLNDYVYGLMEETTMEFDNRTPLGLASTFRYRSQAFSGGSDHAEFTEATTRVPCVMLLQWPDLFYHTSMDTIDKVSEDSLKRVGWVVTIAALTLANATHEDVFTLTHQTASKGMTRIIDASVEAVKEMLEKKTQTTKDEKNKLANELAKTVAYYKNKIEHAVWREQQSVKSVKRLGEHPELATLIDKYCEDLRELGKSETRKLEEALNFIAKTSAIKLEKLEETQIDQETKRLVPKRLFKGTLNDDVLKRAIGEEEYEWYELIDDKDEDFGKKMAEILNFMDGKRAVHDIIKAVSAEYSPTDPENVMKFLKDLKKAKLVTF